MSDCLTPSIYEPQLEDIQQTHRFVVDEPWSTLFTPIQSGGRTPGGIAAVRMSSSRILVAWHSRVGFTNGTSRMECILCDDTGGTLTILDSAVSGLQAGSVFWGVSEVQHRPWVHLSSTEAVVPLGASGGPTARFAHVDISGDSITITEGNVGIGGVHAGESTNPVAVGASAFIINRGTTVDGNEQNLFYIGYSGGSFSLIQNRDLWDDVKTIEPTWEADDINGLFHITGSYYGVNFREQTQDSTTIMVYDVDETSMTPVTLYRYQEWDTDLPVPNADYNPVNHTSYDVNIQSGWSHCHQLGDGIVMARWLVQAIDARNTSDGLHEYGHVLLFRILGWNGTTFERIGTSAFAHGYHDGNDFLTGPQAIIQMGNFIAFHSHVFDVETQSGNDSWVHQPLATLLQFTPDWLDYAIVGPINPTFTGTPIDLLGHEYFWFTDDPNEWPNGSLNDGAGFEYVRIGAESYPYNPDLGWASEFIRETVPDANGFYDIYLAEHEDGGNWHVRYAHSSIGPHGPKNCFVPTQMLGLQGTGISLTWY